MKTKLIGSLMITVTRLEVSRIKPTYSNTAWCKTMASFYKGCVIRWFRVSLSLMWKQSYAYNETVEWSHALDCYCVYLRLHDSRIFIRRA